MQCFLDQKYKCLHHKAKPKPEPGRAGSARVCGGHDAWSPSSQQSMHWEPKAPTRFLRNKYKYLHLSYNPMMWDYSHIGAIIHLFLYFK